MIRRYRLRNVVMLTLILTSAVHADLPSNTDNQPVTVTFKNGRRAKAYLDPRTDSVHLWLRFGTDRTRLTRLVDWDDVTIVRHDGEVISRDDAPLSARTDTKAPSSATRPSDLKRESFTALSHTSPAEFKEPRTRSVRFDTTIANWDEDVEVDGLMIQVVPVSASGQPATFRGQMHVELWAMRRVEQDSSPHSTGRTLEILSRWSVPIHVGREDPQPWIKLPFQTRHPEFDANWSSIGLVHVQLSCRATVSFIIRSMAFEFAPLHPFAIHCKFKPASDFFLPS